jgi:hypothetical protein
MTEETASETSKDQSTCPRCQRALSALRDTRKRLREALQQNLALKEELLAAGEMMDDLAAELDKHS